MVKIMIPGTQDMEPDELEEKLKKDLDEMISKSGQLRNFKQEDLSPGGRYYKSYLNFKKEFSRVAWNYILYHITEYIFISSQEILCSFLLKKETKETVKTIIQFFSENRREEAEESIISLRNTFVSYWMQEPCSVFI